MSKKSYKTGDRVQCLDTQDWGAVIGVRGELPVVRFENGAEGVCSHATPPTSRPRKNP